LGCAKPQITESADTGVRLFMFESTWCALVYVTFTQRCMYKSHQQKASKITHNLNHGTVLLWHKEWKWNKQYNINFIHKLIATVKTSLPGCPQFAANDGDSCEHHQHHLIHKCATLCWTTVKISCLKITSHAIAASLWKYDGSHMDWGWKNTDTVLKFPHPTPLPPMPETPTVLSVLQHYHVGWMKFSTSLDASNCTVQVVLQKWIVILYTDSL
jgi:hypothetical protein